MEEDKERIIEKKEEGKLNLKKKKTNDTDMRININNTKDCVLKVNLIVFCSNVTIQPSHNPFVF